jgi:hypothetical protein
VVVLYVPEAVARFVCEPEDVVNGPKTQVASWLLLTSATGKANGAVSGVPSPSTQEQPARLNVSSLTLIVLRGTSPIFSTANR